MERGTAEGSTVLYNSRKWISRFILKSVQETIMGTKQDVISALFKECKAHNNFVFHNDLVKDICKELGFGNPFDVTKIDNSSLLPDDVKKNDYFIVHLGGGSHQFVKGIKYGYHKFETILQLEKRDWQYRQSLLNEFDTSESNILSVASNQKIIHDFLFEDIVASPKVYNARRTKRSFEYRIGDQTIVATNLQMEIDLTFEYHGFVTIIEGKNGFPEDFAVYQLFHPFQYYWMLEQDHELEIKQIACCYISRVRARENSVIRIYNYTFDSEDNIGSIRLLKKAEYKLILR